MVIINKNNKIIHSFGIFVSRAEVKNFIGTREVEVEGCKVKFKPSFPSFDRETKLLDVEAELDLVKIREIHPLIDFLIEEDIKTFGVNGAESLKDLSNDPLFLGLIIFENRATKIIEEYLEKNELYSFNTPD